jgi:hypothetical protein
MHARYDDITSRIAMRPIWYDEGGVPRYSTFSPEHCSNIAASECALFEIACQECLRTFFICQTGASVDATGTASPLADWIRENVSNYCGVCGDPPRHGIREAADRGCLAGDSMTSLAIRVVEYWRRFRADWNWTRDESLEIVFEIDEEERERVARRWTEK